MSRFALLAPSKKKKPVVAGSAAGSAAAEPSKAPALTSEQKAILAEQRAQREKKKAERAEKKEIESRCYFYAVCGNKKDGAWNYCGNCYKTNTVKCDTCGATLTLSGANPGEHIMCKVCS